MCAIGRAKAFHGRFALNADMNVALLMDASVSYFVCPVGTSQVGNASLCGM